MGWVRAGKECSMLVEAGWYEASERNGILREGKGKDVLRLGTRVQGFYYS